MILVLLGTQHNSFTRLLDEIKNCIDSGLIKERVFVQAGFTKYDSTPKMKIFDLIQKDELEDMINNANFIISHGGVGSIMMGLEKGKKVIAVPRLSKYSEHVNDHQRDIVKVFKDKGFILGAQNVEDLPDILKKIDTFEPKKYKSDNSKMLNIIEDFIDKI